MRGRTIFAALLLSAVTVSSLVLPGAAQTTRTVTVTPDSGLGSGDVVTISGSGFAAGVLAGTCQAVITGTLGIEDCGSPIPTFITDAGGGFSTQFTIQRF